MNPVSLIVDDDRQLMIFRLRGDMSPKLVATSLMEHVGSVPVGPSYNYLIDARNLEGPLLNLQSLFEMASIWQGYLNRVEAGRRVAFVRRRGLAHHPLEHMFDAFYGQREVRHFSDFDEALDWIKQPRETSEAATRGAA